MNQVASQTEIGKICSKQSPCSPSRLSRPADTSSGALSHGQDPQLPFRAVPSCKRRSHNPLTLAGVGKEVKHGLQPTACHRRQYC